MLAGTWDKSKSKVIFILSRYINYKKHELPGLFADWMIIILPCA